MIVRVQKVLVTVVTTDTNPASVVASVDAALSSLTSSKHRIYLTSGSAVGNDPTEHEIPDEPYGGEPDNLDEIRKHDDWMNNYVCPLSGD
jgi:hypothetical protein